jgi:hypothetical protein
MHGARRGIFCFGLVVLLGAVILGFMGINYATQGTVLNCGSVFAGHSILNTADQCQQIRVDRQLPVIILLILGAAASFGSLMAGSRNADPATGSRNADPVTGTP